MISNSTEKLKLYETTFFIQHLAVQERDLLIYSPNVNKLSDQTLFLQSPTQSKIDALQLRIICEKSMELQQA